LTFKEYDIWRPSFTVATVATDTKEAITKKGKGCVTKIIMFRGLLSKNTAFLLTQDVVDEHPLNVYVVS
jgi:hypothetical protein